MGAPIPISFASGHVGTHSRNQEPTWHMADNSEPDSLLGSKWPAAWCMATQCMLGSSLEWRAVTPLVSLLLPPLLTQLHSLSRCQPASSPFLTRHSVGKQRALELAKRARTNDKSAWNMLLWRRREEEISDIICRASTNTFCSVIPRKQISWEQFPQRYWTQML